MSSGPQSVRVVVRCRCARAERLLGVVALAAGSCFGPPRQTFLPPSSLLATAAPVYLTAQPEPARPRCRPPSKEELTKATPQVVRCDEAGQVVALIRGTSSASTQQKAQTYEFDQVLLRIDLCF